MVEASAPLPELRGADRVHAVMLECLASRRLMRIALALAFVATFAIELLIALPDGAATTYYGLRADASASQLIRVLGYSDSGSYLTAGVDLQDGTISPSHQWILQLWPPGMSYLMAALVAISGGAPIIAMLVVLALVWSGAVVAAIALLARSVFGLVVALVFIVAWVAGPLFTSWPTHGGVIGSDGIAAAIAVMTTCSLLAGVSRGRSQRSRIILFIAAGLGLTALAYLRIIWFYAIAGSAAILIVGGVVAVVILHLRGRPRPETLFPWTLLAVVVALLCAPWTIYGATVLHPGNLSWSQGDYQWSQEWMDDAYLESVGGSFLIEGEANWACELEETKCAQIVKRETIADTPYSGQPPYTFDYYRNQSLKAAAAHPFEYTVDRAVATWRTWLSLPGDAVGTFGNSLWGIATMLAFVAALVISAVRLWRGSLVCGLILVLLGANLGVLWLTHFETRYLIAVQGMSLLIAAHALVTWRSSRVVPRDDDQERASGFLPPVTTSQGWRPRSARSRALRLTTKLE